MRFGLLLLALGLSLLPCRGLTVRPPSFEELVVSADVIVAGEIVSISSVLHPIGGRDIPFTEVTIAVEDVLKGQAGPSLVLRHLGGTAGGRSLEVVGLPSLLVGDRGFFFVQDNGRQFFPLVGISHGVYWTIHDQQSGRDWVVRSNGEPLRSSQHVSVPLGEEKPGWRRRASASPDAGLSAADFTTAIKQQLRHGAR